MALVLGRFRVQGGSGQKFRVLAPWFRRLGSTLDQAPSDFTRFRRFRAWGLGFLLMGFRGCYLAGLCNFLFGLGVLNPKP